MRIVLSILKSRDSTNIKRQQMNALYVIKKYLDIKNGKLPERKITVFFGGKAAPAYIIAQDIIHLILCLSELINNDPEVNKILKCIPC